MRIYKFLTKYELENIKKVYFHVFVRIKGVEMKKLKLNENYIVGFVDGEGTFNSVKYPDGRVRPQFLVFNTNKGILKAIKSTLRLKAPILEVSRVKDVIRRRKKMYRLQVRSKDDIQKVIKFFNKFPPIVKRLDYMHFKKIYEKWIR
jgi:hypothetical protein